MLFFRRRPAAASQPEPVPVGGLPLPDAALPAPEVPLSPRRRWLRRISRGFAVFAILFILLVGWLAITAPLSKSLEPIAPPQITLLASDGTPIARIGAIVDTPVKAKDLPKHVTGAFLAIEDRRFYSHWGVDPRSVARAVWSNITGGRTQGGSTITQQLAKFTFLTPKRTLGRKAREAMIAFWLEAWLSKDEILERYLSNAYFGDNTYGLRAASMHYFYRQPEKLTPAQAAMLAGLVQAPSRLAPTRNPDLAEKRMRLVVGAMVDTGYLTAGEAKALRTPRIDVRSRNTLPTGTYFADWALPEARKLSDVGYARQTIRTTLDSRLQAAARRAINGASLGKAQVALVAMRPNGEVVAMVGGRDYADSPFNRVTQAQRQPGSTFKLFVYLAALRAGWDPDDVIDNGPIETGSYRPKNAGEAYSRTITLEDAFAASSNVAAVRLLREVGDDKVIDMARDLGVTAPLAKGDPSLALGTSSMTLLELTAAYAGVAANSYPVVPHAFKTDEPGWFERLFSGPDSFGSGVHDDIEQMLRAAVNRGTGRAARLPQANFGKTGTSQDNRDALFVGYANGLVVGIWIGNDDNSPLRGVSGGGAPARIWRDFMTGAAGTKKRPAAPAKNPAGPVQPLDIPDIGAVPIGETTRVGVQDGNAVISTEIGGTRIDLKLPINESRPGEAPPAAPTPPQ
ncbi:penicillin-binding protein 1A [Sphingopyxis panaciterrae]|uniref:transglycosylase domain-containing protein n=1 Tax=Sphingopyxis panaciterrae TaxID=363841 RepID=UPI00141F55CE|nr:transglycosylase domain-containing protein [Sphingopyxis panaciterrae]NIJ37076.1 penicillin-binding protein 1A [Sphingopyxis panaciterrae]